MRGGKTTTYPAFPAVEADLGYNPARFLDQPADEEPAIGETSPFATTWAVVRGIDDVHTIRQWCNVEAVLGRGQNGGPRKRVIKKLNTHKCQIESDDAAEAPSRVEENTVYVAQSEAVDTDTAEADTNRDDDVTEPTDEAASSSTAPTPSTEATSATDDSAEPVADSTCATCGEDLSSEEIAGQLGYWCPSCCDFQEPASTSAPAVTTGHRDPALAADGGATEPATTPICPDCRGGLTREEAGDEVAFWCSPCGGFKEPLKTVSMEANT